jgi:hypothetical protein
MDVKLTSTPNRAGPDAAASKRERKRKRKRKRPQLTLRSDGLYPDWFLTEQHYHCSSKTLDRRRKAGLIPPPDLFHGNVALTKGSTIQAADEAAAQQALTRREVDAGAERAVSGTGLAAHAKRVGKPVRQEVEADPR